MRLGAKLLAILFHGSFHFLHLRSEDKTVTKKPLDASPPPPTRGIEEHPVQFYLSRRHRSAKRSSN